MKLNQGISIIIPTYNEAGTINVLLEQILELEDDKKIQVIVVDAKNSNDNLSTAISSFPVEVISSQHTSRAKQMNEGAKHAKYDILYFVHADALPPKGFYQDINNSLSKGNEFGYFSYQFDSSNIFLKINTYFSKFNGFYTGGGDQTFFINKSLFDTMNGFDSNLQLCEDFDMHRRLKKANRKFEIIHNPVIISDRKYQKSNYFWINMVNFYILTRFKLGHNPDVLKKAYVRLIK